MPHEETIRIVPNAKTAVLFMHGICGSPEHFRDLVPLEDLVPQNWSCYNVLIDGHGKQAEDFSHSSMKRWEAQVMDIFLTLCQTHDRVIPVGHSMGTLFALQMALNRPDKVPFLFLLAAPLRVGLRWSGICNLIRFSFGKLDLKDPVQTSIYRASGITPTWKVWKYIGWIPRLLELLGKIRQTVALLPDLQTRTIAFQSRNDEMVSCTAGRLLQHNGVEVHELLNSTHFYYHEKDLETTQTIFRSLCAELDNM